MSLMQRLKIILSIIVFYSFISCSYQPEKTSLFQEIERAITLEETKYILSELASDKMKGRDLESGGYDLAAEFAIDFFKENEVKPFYPSYRDSFYSNNVSSFNIVGIINKYDKSKETILIGAHLDHLGQEQNGDQDLVYNGANDNASGCTAVLQIGKFLSKKSWNKNIILVLFAEEENGLLGSAHLAKKLKDEGVSLSYMINFEMLGVPLSSGQNKINARGYDFSNFADELNEIYPQFVERIDQKDQFELFSHSDNYWFYLEHNIPTETFTTFDYQNYEFLHNKKDEIQKLDTNHLNQIIIRLGYSISKLIYDDTELITINL